MTEPTDECICYGLEERGFSVCGLVCPVHWRDALQTIRTRNEHLLQENQELKQKIEVQSKCFKDIGILAMDYDGCQTVEQFKKLVDEIIEMVVKRNPFDYFGPGEVPICGLCFQPKKTININMTRSKIVVKDELSGGKR